MANRLFMFAVLKFILGHPCSKDNQKQNFIKRRFLQRTKEENWNILKYWNISETFLSGKDWTGGNDTKNICKEAQKWTNRHPGAEWRFVFCLVEVPSSLNRSIPTGKTSSKPLVIKKRLKKFQALYSGGSWAVCVVLYVLGLFWRCGDGFWKASPGRVNLMYVEINWWSSY